MSANDDLSDVSMPEESDDSDSDNEPTKEDGNQHVRGHQAQRSDQYTEGPGPAASAANMGPLNDPGTMDQVPTNGQPAPPGRVTQQSLPSSLPPRPATFHGYSGFGRPPHLSSAYPPPPGVSFHTNPLASNFPAGLPTRFESPALYGAYNPPETQKVPRTKEEAEKIKLARRAEIERRCLELNPPLSPSVLVHMPSFQASLVIIKPLDDTAWDMLKPRLLSQRAAAEQREKERLASSVVLQQRQSARQDESKVFADVSEREWEETQVIVTKRIDAYSKEIIRDGWADGKKVTRDNSPRFAVEVLLYVRKRFYAEVAKDDAAARTAGHPPLTEPPNGPSTRKLTLENMRWVFEAKIKPHTDQHRKEVFLCNACDTYKWYAFEGVCQHYASKHTNSLSSGNVVVNWRAEWPEEPPFNPEPSLVQRPRGPASEAAEPSPQSVPPPALAPIYPPSQAGFPAQAIINVSGAPTYPSQVPRPTQQPQLVDIYNPQAVTYVAPGPYQPYPLGAQMPQYPGPVGPIYAPFYQQPQPMAYTNPSISTPQTSVPLTQAYLTSALMGPVIGQQHGEPSTGIEAQSHIPRPVYRTEEYRAQLQDLAQTAKALWTETSGVKDMPGSVRVHVILFHLLQRLRERYTEEPSFSMLVDGIQNVKEMRIVRNVNGIGCKTCAIEIANKPINPYTVSAKSSAGSDRKLYSLPQLVNHFQTAHIEDTHGSSRVDWRTDMVDLPSKKKIASLRGSAGMDEHKFRLLRDALPDAFKPASPIPVADDLAPSMDNHEAYYTMLTSRSPSPKLRKLNPVHKRSQYHVDHAPEHNRSRASARASTFHAEPGPSSMKRKATSPLGGNRTQVLADSARYFNDDEDNEEDYPDHYQPPVAPPGYVARPEYNHREADLSRLLASASQKAQPDEATGHPDESMYAQDSRVISGDNISRTSNRPPTDQLASRNQAKVAAERFLEDMAPNARLEQPHAQQERGAVGYPFQYDGYRERGQSRGAQYIESEGDAEKIGNQIHSRVEPLEAVLQRAYDAQRRSQGPPDERSVSEEAAFVDKSVTYSQAPSRELRYIQPEITRYPNEHGASGLPVYVVEEPPRRRQYRAVSPGGQHFIDEPPYELRPAVRRMDHPEYGQHSEHYRYGDEQQPRSRPVHYEPEVEYVRVRDPAGDYLIERPKARQRPIYARYGDSEASRQPLYDDGGMRPVYEEEHGPARVSQGHQRPMQRVYVDEPRPMAAHYEAGEADPNMRYEERPRPVVLRMEDDGGPHMSYEERPRSRPVLYEGEQQRRQPVYEHNALNPLPISRSDPAYYEEYDPHNPAPLPDAPRRVPRRE